MHESACKLIYNKFLFQVYEFLGVPDPAKHSHAHAPAVLPRDGAVILSYGGGNGPDDLKLVFETAVKKYNVVLLNITQCLKGRVEDAYAVVSKFNIDTLNAYMHEYILSVKTEVLLRMFDPCNRYTLMAPFGELYLNMSNDTLHACMGVMVTPYFNSVLVVSACACMFAYVHCMCAHVCVWVHAR